MRLVLAVVWVLLPMSAAAQPVPGTRDVTFHEDGVAEGILSPSQTTARDVAIDAEDRIVVVGRANTGAWDIALARYRPDGTLDPTFGGDGVVTTPIGSGTFDVGEAISIQPDGRIVVVGRSEPPGGSAAAIVRYLPDGSLDGSFGAGGLVVTDLPGDLGNVYDVLLQPDGKILVGAASNNPATGWDVSVYRHQANGFLDATFGTAGLVRLALNGAQWATRLALSSTGRILLTADTDAGGLLARLRSTGELDDTFGSFGLVVNPRLNAAALAVQPDGAIAVAGGVPGQWGCCWIGLSRHARTGPLDTSFADEGVATSPLGGVVEDMTLQANGKVVVAGAYDFGGGVVLLRWNPDGTPDDGFVVEPRAPVATASAFYGVAVQRDGKLVAVGHDPLHGFHVVRYHGDRPDLIFADGFESGGTTAWSTSAADGGDLQVAAGAAANATAFGLLGSVDDTAPLYVQDDTPEGEGRYRARFALDPRDFDPGEAQDHRRSRTFLAFAANPQRRVAAIVLRRLNGAYAVMGRARLDNNAQADTGWTTIGGGAHWIELDLQRSSAPDANDGWFRLWVDGAPVADLGALDNHFATVDFVRLGALSLKGGASGTLSWDEFESRRQTEIGP